MRCYNGQPDRELQTYLDERERTRAIITSAGFSVTYFPEGEFYMAFKDYLGVTGECKTLHEVARELKIL